MDPLTIGAVGMLALFALIVLKVPIGYAMMAVGVIGFALQTKLSAAGILLASEPSNLLSSVDLATLPLFLLMGTFANAAGFSADIYAAAASFVGHRRGGLAYATIGGCAAFGAVCGSSTATAATFAKIALPEMIRRRYSPGFSAGAVAAGGTLKALIPPSLVMILYCIIAKTFIYDLFAAAVIPALLTIVLNLMTVSIAIRLNPAAASGRSADELAGAGCGAAPGDPGFYPDPRRVRRIVQRHFHRQRSRLGRGRRRVCFRAAPRPFESQLHFEGMREAARVTAMLYTILMGAAVFTYS